MIRTRKKPYKAYSEGEDQKNPQDTSDLTIRWWEGKEEELGDKLTKVVKAQMDDQSDYLLSLERNLNMYRNLQSSGTLPLRYLKADGSGEGYTRRISLNVVRPMCNTVASKIFKERPRAMYHTDGAGRAARNRVKEIQDYRDGWANNQKLYRKSTRAGLDALVMGTGYLKNYETPGTRPGLKLRSMIKRVFTPQVLVDRIDGADGDPRMMYEIEFVDRDELCWRFPDLSDKIREKKPTWGDIPNLWWRNIDQEHNRLMVCHGYRLPSEEGADDGAWVTSLDELTLDSGRWDHCWHPYSVLRWLESPDGFYGMSLPEELRGLQAELNRLMRRIQAAMILLSSPFVMVDKMAGVEQGHIKGIPGTIIRHNTRMEPQVVSFSVMHPEVFAHIDRIYQRSFEVSGISQLSASAKVPSNLESGRALLVHDDAQSDRLAGFSRNWQEFHLEVDQKGLETAARINETVKTIDSRSKQMKEVNWKDMDVALNGFVIRASPTALLANEPAGKLDSLERLDQRGLILERPDKLELFHEDPDLGGYIARETAAKRHFEQMIEGMLYDNAPYEPPDGALPLDQGIRIAQALYIEAKADRDISESALDKVVKWIDAARLTQKAAKPPAPPMQPNAAALPAPVPPGAPPGMPMPMIPPEMPIPPGGE